MKPSTWVPGTVDAIPAAVSGRTTRARYAFSFLAFAPDPRLYQIGFLTTLLSYGVLWLDLEVPIRGLLCSQEWAPLRRNPHS